MEGTGLDVLWIFVIEEHVTGNTYLKVDISIAFAA